MIEMIIGKKNRPLIDLGIITTVIILLVTALSETASAGLTATSLDFAENYLAVKWAYKSGDGWENSPLPPTVGGGYVYSAADGELLKFRKEDGKIEKKVSLPGMQGFSLIPIRYIKKDEYTEGKNLLLIPVYNEKLPENGERHSKSSDAAVGGEKVQVYDADTLDLIGSTRLQQDKQILTAVKYNEGYFYFGTWGDDKNDSTYTENVYSCYSIGDITYNKDKGKETEPVWTVEKNGGFYFADAFFTGDYVLFGSDRDTTKSSSYKGAMIFSCMSGGKYRKTQADDPVISVKPLEGDARSAVVSDDTDPSIILVATKGKKLYKFKLSAGGELEKPEGKTEIDIDAQTTGAPAVYKGIIYMGLSNCTVEGVKISTMEKINAVSVPNYPQAGIYISKSVNEENGLFIYGSYNKPPGGIFLLKVDSSGSISESEPANKQFFTPVKKMSEYCLSPLQVEDQVIYYKNDSGYIMALENGFTITTHAAAGGKLTPDPDTGKCTYKKGASVSFKAEAHAGYMMADFVKDGESVRKSGYGPADNEEGCDFYNLLDNHMVKAVFMLKTAKKPSEVKDSAYNRLTVKWPVTTGAQYVRLYRSTRAGGGYKYIGKSRTTSYSDKKVMTGTKYYYKLQGVYKMACGHFNYTRISSCKSGRTTLRATKLKGKAEKRKVRLCWKKVRGANGYIICRANRKSGRYKIIKTVKGNSKLKYTDSRLKKGGTYCYKVKAYRAVSSKRIKSVYSNTVKVKAM